MSIVSARLDYRLLHGIVATQWTPYYSPMRIMIVDTKTADNQLLKDSMRLGKPAGVACSIISEETALKNFKANKYDGQKIFMVTENPRFILNLINSGEKVEELVLGISRTSESGRKISHRYTIFEEDEDVFTEISNKGVPIYVQYIPSEKKELFITKK